jgi:hypothetical protein
MPRKRKDAGATAVAETPAPQSSGERPAYIDGPPVNDQGHIIKDEAQPTAAVAESPTGEQGQGEGRNWSDPYKSLFKTASFEMGENRRYKQRVFMFKEKPSDEILAALKDNGFTYRANEKAWTIHADADSRRLTDELAREFAGPAQAAAMSR